MTSIKTVISLKRGRLRYLVAALVLMLSTLSSLIPLDRAAAYTYVDPSYTTKDSCVAAGGDYQSLGQNSTTGEYSFNCVLKSDPATESKMLLRAGWLANCLADIEYVLRAEQVQEFDLSGSGITDNSKVIGHVIQEDDGQILCKTAGNVRSQVLAIGYTNLATLLRVAGCTEDDNHGYSCTALPDNKEILRRIVTGIYGAGSNALTNADKYWIALNTFIIGCKASPISNPTEADTGVADAGDGNTYRIKLVDPTSVTAQSTVASLMVDTLFKAEEGRNTNVSTASPSLDWEDGTFWCESLAGMINDYADDFALWVMANPTVAAQATNQDPDAEAESTCTIDGIGWIVCPVVNFLAMIADASFGFMSDHFLKTNPAIFSNSGPTYDAWTIIRNLANIAFVIVFLIIIFSQLSSLGISNYGVKKMLPRLVIAAILVNVSYFVAQIAVDISNILGYSIKGLFDSIAASATPVDLPSVSQGATGGGFAGVAGGVLAVVGTVAIGYALLSTLIPVLLAAVISLVMILFILVARQALIILLVVISPLAFVAFLLPNTEQWFKKWQKTFTALLMVFPIVAVVFGASSLASTILANTYSLGPDDSTNWFGQIISAAILVLPLFVVPGLLKKSIDGAGGIGAKINGLGNKLGGALGKKGAQGFENSRLGQYKKYKAQRNDINRAKIQSGVYEGRGGKWNPNNLRSSANKAINSGPLGGPLGGKFGDRLSAGGIALVNKEEKEAVDNAAQLIRARSNPTKLIGPPGQQGDAEKALVKAIASGDTTAARAATQILLGSGPVGLKKLRTVLGSDGMAEHEAAHAETFSSLRTDIGAAGVKAKDAALAMYSYSGKPMAANENAPDLLTGLNPVELAGQDAAILQQHAQAGRISQTMAQAVMGNPNATQLLNPTTQALFESLANGSAGASTSTAGGAVETSQAPGETYVALHSQPTMSDFERAEAEELERRRPPQNPS